MIDALTAKVIEQDNNILVLQTNQHDYRIKIITNNLKQFTLNEIVKIYLWLYFDTCAYKWFGFYDLKTRDMFNNLLQVPSVGIKIATSILNTFSEPEMMDIIKTNNFDKLQEVKEVRSHHAKAIINTFKQIYLNTIFNNNQKKAITSLTKLGYDLTRIYLAIDKIKVEYDDFDQYITALLKIID